MIIKSIWGKIEGTHSKHRFYNNRFVTPTDVSIWDIREIESKQPKHVVNTLFETFSILKFHPFACMNWEIVRSSHIYIYVHLNVIKIPYQNTCMYVDNTYRKIIKYLSIEIANCIVQFNTHKSWKISIIACCIIWCYQTVFISSYLFIYLFLVKTFYQA